MDQSIVIIALNIANTLNERTHITWNLTIK